MMQAAAGRGDERLPDLRLRLDAKGIHGCWTASVLQETDGGRRRRPPFIRGPVVPDYMRPWASLAALMH